MGGRLGIVVSEDAVGLGEAVILQTLTDHPRDRLAVLDGSNRFNPYVIARVAQEQRLPPRALLARVLVSRAFTCIQMEALAARPFPAPRAVVLGLVNLLCDEEVKPATARRLMALAIASLGRREVVCVEAHPGPGRAAELFSMLAARADFVREVEL